MFYVVDSREFLVASDFFLRMFQNQLPGKNIENIKKYYERKLQLIYEIKNKEKIVFIVKTINPTIIFFFFYFLLIFFHF